MSATLVETLQSPKPISLSKRKKKGSAKKAPEDQKKTISLPQKRRKTKSSRSSLKRSTALYPEESTVPEDVRREEMKLSFDRTPVARLQQILEEKGILGNKEAERRIQLARCKVDPLYTIFFYPDHPETAILDQESGKKIPLIDYMLKECFRLLCETLGPTFTSFKLITETFNNLMSTDDVHAKQWLFLFILEREPPVRDMVMELYTTEMYTPHRLEAFLQKLHQMTESTVALPYTDALNDYNVKNMVLGFLQRCVSDYMVYEKDPALAAIYEERQQQLAYLERSRAAHRVPRY